MLVDLENRSHSRIPATRQLSRWLLHLRIVDPRVPPVCFTLIPFIRVQRVLSNNRCGFWTRTLPSDVLQPVGPLEFLLAPSVPSAISHHKC